MRMPHDAGQEIVLLLIAAAVVVGSARLLWAGRRAQPHPRAWRLVLLLVLQLLSAALLYRALFPPAIATRAETLVVATAQAPANLASSLAANERLVALPEAGAIASSEP